MDEAAMLGALEAEGTVIGVMADSLLKAATSSKYRKHLSAQNLVLVSPYYPDAGFNAGNAMARNKYIYCLSYAAVVVQSDTKGGTWNGALENLKEQWVPLYVKETDNPDSGNAQIIKKGGNPLSEDLSLLEFSKLMSSVQDRDTSSQDLFKHSAVREEVQKYPTREDGLILPIENLSLYEIFLLKLQPELSIREKTPDEICEALKINKTQLNLWLTQAVKYKKIMKLTRPVRYQWLGDDPQMRML